MEPLAEASKITSTANESKRIKKLRKGLIAAVPRFPNDRASLKAMESKHLTDLMIAFVAWRLRYVGQRPRKVASLRNLASDTRATALKPNLDAFLAAVETGADLTPYLSLEPHKRGYTPAAESGRRGADKWSDKDLLLNVMGLHHFHLGLTKEAAGHFGRTNEVLFASVTRDQFEIIGLFDHDAFEHEDSGAMTDERKKLWRAYEERRSAGALPGQLTMGGFGGLGVTLGAHPTAVVRAAQRLVGRVNEVDPKLEDAAFVNTLYGNSQVPAKPKPEWCFRHLDFGLYDKGAGHFGVFEYGPN
jgi:hypothetical protein